MKRFKLITIILILFLKTGNILSNENIFNVNNIEIEKKANKSDNELANEAITAGFKQLIKKILLFEDKNKLSQLNFSQIKDLVLYYQVIDESDSSNGSNKIRFNIFFNKEKLHNLFYARNILYSEVTNKEIYLLPVIKKGEEIYIYNKNYFYENWNKKYITDLVEFILPLEKIEVIRNITLNKDSIFNIDLRNLFQEYTSKNLALILIDETNANNSKIYLKTNILGKNIDKSLPIKRQNLATEEFYEKIIIQSSNEIINIIKSQNLIDIKTPSFINTKLVLKKNNNLVELNKRLKKIDSIDDIFVQEFNKDYVLIKIKYLGKLDKIINQLKNQGVTLKLSGEEWSLNII